jgi:TRAP-type C4-dicarboxylate transport system permease small subunit
MTPLRILGVLLILAGVAGLVYGGFSYTKEEHKAKLGPLQFSVKEKETVAVPVWLSVAAVAAGTVLLVINRKK